MAMFVYEGTNFEYLHVCTWLDVARFYAENVAVYLSYAQTGIIFSRERISTFDSGKDKKRYQIKCWINLIRYVYEEWVFFNIYPNVRTIFGINDTNSNYKYVEINISSMASKTGWSWYIFENDLFWNFKLLIPVSQACCWSSAL